MSVSEDVLVDAATAGEVRSVLEDAFGGSFTDRPAGSAHLTTGRTVLDLGPHHFEDDRDMPVSRYRWWIEVRDLDKDQARQAQAAARVFEVLKRQHRWDLLLIHDMQRLVDSYVPRPHARAG
jgi:hypothetical protein